VCSDREVRSASERKSDKAWRVTPGAVHAPVRGNWSRRKRSAQTRMALPGAQSWRGFGEAGRRDSLALASTRDSDGLSASPAGRGDRAKPQASGNAKDLRDVPLLNLGRDARDATTRCAPIGDPIGQSPRRPLCGSRLPNCGGYVTPVRDWIEARSRWLTIFPRPSWSRCLPDRCLGGLCSPCRDVLPARLSRCGTDFGGTAQ